VADGPHLQSMGFIYSLVEYACSIQAGAMTVAKALFFYRDRQKM
jgi:hypothetical protein